MTRYGARFTPHAAKTSSGGFPRYLQTTQAGGAFRDQLGEEIFAGLAYTAIRKSCVDIHREVLRCHSLPSSMNWVSRPGSLS